jgi:hypothetical protein
MTNEDDKIIHCTTCKEIINTDAAKCIHCGSFQNWRRHLDFGSSILSMMIAFISVVTVFITVVANSTMENNSNINASIINWQRSFITDGQIYQVLNVEIFVTNTGQRPGAVKTVAIRGDGEKQFQYMRSELVESSSEYLHEGVKSQIVEPGKTLLLKKHLKASLTVDEFEKKYKNSDLRVQIVNFNGREKEIILEIRNTPLHFYK